MKKQFNLMELYVLFALSNNRSIMKKSCSNNWQFDAYLGYKQKFDARYSLETKDFL